MSAAGWVRVPVGRDAALWRTVPTTRVVLGVVHTVASAEAVLDAIELVEPDARVQVIFTQAPGVFTGGVLEHLRAAGAIVIPWDQAVHAQVDLAVAADSEGVHELNAPVLALAHGIVNNKLAPTALGGPGTGLVVGLAAPWLTWYGRLVPTAIALAHRDAIEVLRRQCPEAVPIARATGDVTLGRLLASAPRRAWYRRSLGVRQGQTVVAVSSTWGPDSLFGGDWQALLDRLSGLTHREFAVHLVMHPAVWFGHGRRQILAWSRSHRGAGVRLVEPTRWRGLVAAADVLIGDHGSATVYAAAAGVPVLRAVPPARGTAPGSAAARLTTVAPALTDTGPLSAQIVAAVRSWRAGGNRSGRIAAAVSSPGAMGAAARLRHLMYELLRLPEPTEGCLPAPVGAPVLVKAEEVPGG